MSKSAMDDARTGYKPNPKLTANPLSRLFFCWLFPIFAAGREHELGPGDLYEVLPENLSAPIADRLESYWHAECEEARKRGTGKPSLARALRETLKWTFLKYALHFFVSHLVLKTVQPLMVGYLIWHFDERSDSSASEGYGYASAFVLTTICDVMLFNQMWFGLKSIGISARVACASLLYRKIMRLPESAKQVTGGRIINLLSNDVGKLEFCFLFLHILWVLPIQLLLVTYLMWLDVGAAAILGVLSLIVQTVPVQAFSGRIIARLRRKIAARTDERILLTKDIVRGIRLIKMYTWERPFEQLVFLARRHEIGAIAAASYLKTVLWSVMAFAQRTPLFVTVMIYVLQGHGLSSHTVFTLIQYFNILHVMTGSYYLRAVNTISEAAASIKRMQEFLLLEEQMPGKRSSAADDEADDAIVSIVGVSASSIEKPEVNFLHDIELRFRRALLYAVVGPVGAGKSSLLKLILDELRPNKGEVRLRGDISYASQEAWIFRGSVRSNILFGEALNPERYERVTRACALIEDFAQLPNGDETIVGEDGATLSGGQRARVGLARAVYRDADVYLLDDPLSAVDSRVGKRLFDDCVNGLLKDKTRLLITHQLQYLRQADEIVLIDKGRVEYQGDFANLPKSEELFQYLNLNETDDSNSIKKRFVGDPIASDRFQSNDEADDDERSEPPETEKLIASKSKLVKVEKSGKPTKSEITASEKSNIYWRYFTAGGSCLLPFATFVAFVVAQFLCSGCDYFVAYWTRRHDARRYASANATTASPEIPSENIDSYSALYIFGGLMIGIIIMSVTKMLLYCTACKKSNERIHNSMAACLLRATMPFFEKNDSGQILNRFTKDLGTVDERLQALMLEAIEFAFIILGVVFQLVFINWWLVFIIAFMGFLFWRGRVVAIKTTRDLMRLEGKAKSPVFSHVNSSFAGIVTIRACRAQSMACKQFDVHQDHHTAAASISQYALLAYNFWLDLITLSFTAVLTYSFLLFRNETTAGADVGLAITQVLILCGILARGIKLTGDIETQMVSVERLFQYSELEREDSLGIGQKPPSNWPSHGKIKFDNLSIRYALDDPPVLKNLEFTIEAGSKIGIVGRTGAGKSSLISALFRLAHIDGSIQIDDVDIRKLELKCLRSKISILPQEPVLFCVTLRKNLDPLDEFDDASLWSALQDVELNKRFASLDAPLDQSNLSRGQRQLLCLARAILKRNRILILDEATANVDSSTEALIQKTIRAKFKDCTVLMIAHRLNTIMDCDKVIVLDRGRIVEFDRPQALLRLNDGYFARMLPQMTSQDEQPKIILDGRV